MKETCNDCGIVLPEEHITVEPGTHSLYIRLCDVCVIHRFKVAWDTLAAVVKRRNVAAGWYEKPRTHAESIGLLHSEISEAFEGMREKPGPVAYFEAPDAPKGPDGKPVLTPLEEPIGPIRGFNASLKLGRGGFNCVEEEYADEAIRLLDETGRRGLEVADAIEAKLAFNAQRPHRHGGKTV